MAVCLRLRVILRASAVAMTVCSVKSLPDERVGTVTSGEVHEIVESASDATARSAASRVLADREHERNDGR